MTYGVKGLKHMKKVLLITVMPAVSVSAVGVSAYLYRKSFRDIFILLLITAACFGVAVFSFFQSNIFHTLHYDNGGHFMRFAAAFLVGTAVCCLLPTVPDDGWAVPSLALALSLFSNTVTGMVAYAGLLGVCVYLAEADLLVFLLYFFMGVIFAVLFEKPDDACESGAPIATAMIIYSTVMAAKTVFRSRGMLTGGIFAVPFLNLFITFVIMPAVLRFYRAAVADREKGKYRLLNDRESGLLAKYREEDRQLYNNALHTAYFAEKTARLLHMDVDVAKNGGYYHRIIAAECRKQDKSLDELCRDNGFPAEAVRLLQEYQDPSRKMKMRETAAVYLADCAVSAVMSPTGRGRTGNRKNKGVDYGRIAADAVRRKTDSGILNDSEITLADLDGIKKLYAGEKMYYDSMRRE